MKAIKTLTCATAAAAVLAISASDVQAVGPTTSLTTNDVILNFALTISTNTAASVSTTATNYTIKVASEKLVNKNLLTMLEGSDFANVPFAAGAQIAIAYDGPWNGDVVVVDKTGTNVLYDVTENGHSTNATFAINLTQENGAFSEKYNYKPSGSVSSTAYDGGSFTLLDIPNKVSMTGNGPSTVTFTQILNSSKPFTTNPFASWTDSANFSFFGASNEAALNQTNYVTISGTITGKGKGKGENTYFSTNFIN